MNNTQKKKEDIVNDKYEILNDTYAFLVDYNEDNSGFCIKYCHDKDISVVGKTGSTIEELVNSAYENHLKK